MLMLAMAAQLAMAPVPDAATIDDAGTITVTATRLPDLAAAALQCAAGGCPVRKDIAVTVAYASAMFDTGDYLTAKRVLAGAVRRTAGAARAEPLAVSHLYNAQANLAGHEGDKDIKRSATWASANVLADALPDAALPRLTAEFRLADWQLRTADARGAEARYADLARRATAAGHRQLADGAALRHIQALGLLGRRSDARAELALLAARTDPLSIEVRRAALATIARIAASYGRAGAAQSALAGPAALGPAAEPMLVSQPPMPRPAIRDVPCGEIASFDRGPRGSDFTGLRWVDVGYPIRPDGTTEAVTLLRGSSRLDWAQPQVAQISARRCAPFAGSPDGTYRVERFTLTADYAVPVGSLVRRRMRDPRFETMPMAQALQATAEN